MSNARRLMTALVGMAAAATLTAVPAIADTPSSVSARLTPTKPATPAAHATPAAAPHLRPATADAGSPVSISAFRVHDEVVSSKGNNYFNVALGIKNTDSSVTVDGIVTRVSINGKKVGTVDIYDGDKYYAFNSKWGVGKVTLGPSQIIFYKNNTKYYVNDNTVTKGAQVRMHTKGNFAVKRSGHSYTFNFYAANFFKTGFISAKSVQLQYKSKGTWHLYKTIGLNSDGKAKFVHSFGSTHTWRMVVVRTATIEGGASNGATI